MTNTSLASMSAVEMTHAFTQKTLSPKEALAAVLNRLDQVEPMINAFVHVDREGAMMAAAAAEARYQAGAPLGPLDGVPVSVKDMLLTKGMPTRKGSLTTDPDAPQDVDALGRGACPCGRSGALWQVNDDGVWRQPLFPKPVDRRYAFTLEPEIWLRRFLYGGGGASGCGGRHAGDRQ